MNIEYIRMMFDYNYWAHRQVWACVMELTETQFRENIAYSHGSVHNQVVHTMSAESVWLERLKGTSPRHLFKPSDYPSRHAIRRKWDEIESDFRAYLQSLTEDQLSQNISYQQTSGEPEIEPLWAMLVHVVNHGTDHRAQTLAVMGTLGGPTVEQDLIIYLRTLKKA